MKRINFTDKEEVKKLYNQTETQKISLKYNPPIMLGGWGEIKPGTSKETVEKILGKGSVSHLFENTYDFPSRPDISIRYDEKEGKVLEITFYCNSIYEPRILPKIKLENNLGFFEATIDDILKLYGEPDERDNERGTTLIYGDTRFIFEGIYLESIAIGEDAVRKAEKERNVQKKSAITFNGWGKLKPGVTKKMVDEFLGFGYKYDKDKKSISYGRFTSGFGREIEYKSIIIDYEEEVKLLGSDDVKVKQIIFLNSDKNEDKDLVKTDKGINFNSTEEDVLKAYGSPLGTVTSQKDTWRKCDVYQQEYNDLGFCFDTREDKLLEIRMYKEKIKVDEEKFKNYKKITPYGFEDIYLGMPKKDIEKILGKGEILGKNFWDKDISHYKSQGFSLKYNGSNKLLTDIIFHNLGQENYIIIEGTGITFNSSQSDIEEAFGLPKGGNLNGVLIGFGQNNTRLYFDEKTNKISKIDLAFANRSMSSYSSQKISQDTQKILRDSFRKYVIYNISNGIFLKNYIPEGKNLQEQRIWIKTLIREDGEFINDIVKNFNYIYVYNNDYFAFINCEEGSGDLITINKSEIKTLPPYKENKKKALDLFETLKATQKTKNPICTKKGLNLKNIPLPYIPLNPMEGEEIKDI